MGGAENFCSTHYYHRSCANQSLMTYQNVSSAIIKKQDLLTDSDVFRVVISTNVNQRQAACWRGVDCLRHSPIRMSECSILHRTSITTVHMIGITINLHIGNQVSSVERSPTSYVVIAGYSRVGGSVVPANDVMEITGVGRRVSYLIEQRVRETNRSQTGTSAALIDQCGETCP